MQYKVVDFKGYIKWYKLDDGTYAVDPMYLNEFLDFINN